MSSLSLAVRDSATMLRRNLKRQTRYPTLIMFQIAIPIVMLLLFVFVFGETMGAGLPGAAGAAGSNRGDYLDYVTPAIVLMTIVGGAMNVAIGVAMDMTEGIIDRFRTMAIARVSVLTGHVLGALVQTLIAVAVVVLFAMLLGFRTSAGPLAWLGVLAAVAAITYALTWLSVAMGLASKTVEGASNAPMPLMLLPFLGSGFVPTESMPAAMRWFAEYQPFTPVIDLLRALLFDTPVGDAAWLTLAWSLVIGVGGYAWARRAYNRGPRPA